MDVKKVVRELVLDFGIEDDEVYLNFFLEEEFFIIVEYRILFLLVGYDIELVFLKFWIYGYVVIIFFYWLDWWFKLFVFRVIIFLYLGFISGW